VACGFKSSQLHSLADLSKILMLSFEYSEKPFQTTKGDMAKFDFLASAQRWRNLNIRMPARFKLLQWKAAGFWEVLDPLKSYFSLASLGSQADF